MFTNSSARSLVDWIIPSPPAFDIAATNSGDPEIGAPMIGGSIPRSWYIRPDYTKITSLSHPKPSLQTHVCQVPCAAHRHEYPLLLTQKLLGALSVIKAQFEGLC